MNRSVPFAAFSLLAIALCSLLTSNSNASDEFDLLLESLGTETSPLENDELMIDTSTQLIIENEDEAVESFSDNKGNSDAPTPTPAPLNDPLPRAIPAPVVDPQVHSQAPSESVPAHAVPIPSAPFHSVPMVSGYGVSGYQTSGMSAHEGSCSCGNANCGHRQASCRCNRQGCQNAQSCDGGNGATVCQPHRVPNLPSSSLREYFRGDPCHANLWDGFCEERQKHCDHFHKHIHGRCECGNRGQCESCKLGLRHLDSAILRASSHNGCEGRCGQAKCDGGCDGIAR